jgi:hypothetical protein
MILSDFRYYDPWAKAEEAFTLPNLFHRSQLQQRENQQAEAKHKTLDGLLDKLSQKDIIGLDVAREYLRHKYRQNCKANTLKNDFTTITLFLSYLKKCGRSELNQLSRADLEAFVEHEAGPGLEDRLGEQPLGIAVCVFAVFDRSGSGRCRSFAAQDQAQGARRVAAGNGSGRYQVLAGSAGGCAQPGDDIAFA